MNLRTKKKAESQMLNSIAIQHYLFHLSSIAMAQFDYKNLPDSITKEHIERILFFEGAGVFCYDDIMNEYIFLSVNPNGKYDLNNEPIYRTGYGQNGFHVDLTKYDSVILYNNMLKAPTYNTAMFYAQRIADLQRTFDVNSKALKNPRIFKGQKKQLETFKQIYEQYDGNTPVIYLSDGLDLDNIFENINVDTPNNLESINQAKRELWSEYLNLLGITSTTFQKKERLITDEVSQSLGGAIANYSTRYKTRKNCVEQINKMFNLNIEVIDKYEETKIDNTVLDQEGGEE